ncbi:MAG: peptidylprolyl isomerase, partial [Proteobacteria bacterium]|nr:peptidylprolyl isomerase [Pseudomonadota bacterium]
MTHDPIAGCGSHRVVVLGAFPRRGVHRQGLDAGVGRADEADSGSGAELYVVIGHAPRHLDRNVTLVGRVIAGMEHLSTLPRGTGALGFYEDPAEQVPIVSIRLGTGVPLAERVHLELLRT